MSKRVVVIGAGVAGLVAALELAVQGLAVTVVERAPAPGGKMREVEIEGARLDAGPTVFTMRWVFDEIFSAAHSRLDDLLTLQPAEILARHAWSEHERLDLYADPARSAEAISELCGSQEGRRYLDFCQAARRIYATLERPFIRSPRPTPHGLVRGAGLRGLGNLWQIKPFATMWRALGEHFRDPRLRQLFGRYATYCGSSPFQAPATLMLVAHVEQQGVWLVQGGMHRLAQVLAALAEQHGARFHYACEASEIFTKNGRVAGIKLGTGEAMAADAVVVNADVAALTSGLLGRSAVGAVAAGAQPSRSLSAITWSLLAATDGFPLLRHTVFFSNDYRSEFDDIFRRRRVPRTPTVYVCAQDRGSLDAEALGRPERLLLLVNAPANGDSEPYDEAAISAVEARAFGLLARCGLAVERRQDRTVVTTPATFERLFPATGGALYGRASHGWTAAFARPTSRSRIPGLYLAGGSTHPGPGVPMAALSGRMAAASILADR